MAEETSSKPAKNKAAAAPAQAQGGQGEEERCKADKCKQPVRAKGYCRKHFLAWRRGDLGSKHRYKTCSKEGCRKPAQFAGRCEEHRKGGSEAAAAG